MEGSQSSVWDAAARGYNEQKKSDPLYPVCLRRVVADLHPYGRVLDAGCGTGLGTRLIRRAAELHAIDFSPNSLDVMQADLPHVKGRVADIRDLPYEDNYFDCVLSANTLQHLTPAGQRAAVSELMRVLKPGGHFSISAHHYSIGKRAGGWIKEGKPGQADIDYIYRFTREDFVALFPGAQVRAVAFYQWPCQWFLTRFAGHMLARKGYGDMLIAHGSKSG